MRTLHLLRSEPDEEVRQLIRGMGAPEDGGVVPLADGPVDYDWLVAAMFEHDRVICWW